MMRSSKRRNIYSNRRRRKGRKPLYTRFRCDPDPWNGSPPKTPPSSDDEACANESEYAINSTLSLCSGYTRSSAETVAPAPHVPMANMNRNRRNYGGSNASSAHGLGGRDRLNEVKRKLSKYVKMENANVLQCHQFTRQQTKLNARKTAPVPLPLSFNQNKKNGKSKQKQLKKAKTFKPKPKQKQTAPAPKPPLYVLQQKQKSKQKVKPQPQAKAKAKPLAEEFKMRAFAKSFIPDSTVSVASEHKSVSSDDRAALIDFASIPEAYYVGFDNNIEHSTNKENIQQTSTSTATTITNASNGWYDEVAIYQNSPISTNTNSSTYEHFVMSDFTNSNSDLDSSTISPNHKIEIASNNDKQIVLKDMADIIDSACDCDEEMMYFNDDKFVLLAEQILEEDASQLKQQSPYQYQQQSPWSVVTTHQTNNIWAEPKESTHASAYCTRQTLGGLLMHGLPPISTQLFH